MPLTLWDLKRSQQCTGIFRSAISLFTFACADYCGIGSNRTCAFGGLQIGVLYYLMSQKRLSLMACYYS